MSKVSEEMGDKAQEILEGLNEFNAALDALLPVLLPEVEKTLDKLLPLHDKLLGKFFKGKTFNQLVIIGNASYLARGMMGSELSPEKIAARAVAVARLIKQYASVEVGETTVED